MIAYNKKFVKGLQQLSGKKVLILGFGREGKDALRFLQARFPGIVLGVADRSERNIRDKRDKGYKAYKGIDWHLGKNYLGAIRKYDIIIKSPGVPPKVPYLRRSDLRKIFSEDLFEKKELLPIMKALIDPKKPKPFECVGTKEESRKAFLLSLRNAQKRSLFPFLLHKV